MPASANSVYQAMAASGSVGAASPLLYRSSGVGSGAGAGSSTAGAGGVAGLSAAGVAVSVGAASGCVR